MSNLVQSIRDKGIEAFIEAEDSLPQSMDEIKAVAKQATNAICQRFENLAQMQEQMKQQMQNLIGITLCHLLVEISEKSKLIYSWKKTHCKIFIMQSC